MPELKYLFTIERTSRARGVDVIAWPGLALRESASFRPGMPVLLVRADGIRVRTRLLSIEYAPSVRYVGPRPPVSERRLGVVFPEDVPDTDIAVGTEVWEAQNCDGQMVE